MMVEGVARMADRENVIKSLTEISEYTRARADIAGIGKGKEVFDSWYRAAEDAIAMLREQGPVEPEVSEWLEDSDPGQEYGTTWACRKCMHSIHKPFVWNPYNSGYKHCPHCGARMEVKLDG